MFKINNKDTRAASFDVVYVSSFITLSILFFLEHIVTRNRYSGNTGRTGRLTYTHLC